MTIICITLFAYLTSRDCWLVLLQISRENTKLSSHYAKLEKLAVTSRALITLVDVHDLSLLWPPQCESCVCVVHRLPPDMQYSIALHWYIMYYSHHIAICVFTASEFTLIVLLNRLRAKWLVVILSGMLEMWLLGSHFDLFNIMLFLDNWQVLIQHGKNVWRWWSSLTVTNNYKGTLNLSASSIVYYVSFLVISIWRARHVCSFNKSVVYTSTS